MEITRKAIKTVFPDRQVTIRKVGFSDLARDYAYVLTVSGIDNREDAAKLHELLGNAPTHKGKHILR